MEEVTGNLTFSEYEAKGKVESGKDPRVKLELKNGSIELLDEVCPPGTVGVPPNCDPL